LNFLGGAASFEPFKLEADTEATTCDQTNVPWDDHLRAIQVPILYVGSGGGFGTYGLYTLSLLGSRDIQQHIVSLIPSDRSRDFAHVDLFNAKIAKDQWWSLAAAWIKSHAGSQCQ
jgi:hypothetical protein